MDSGRHKNLQLEVLNYIYGKLVVSGSLMACHLMHASLGTPL